MALLSPQQAKVPGFKPTMVAASAGGDTIRPDDRALLIVKNGDASAKTVTVVVPGTKFEQALPDVAHVIPAGEEWVIGGLVAELADPADGLIDITYSAVTSVTVGLVRT